MFDKLATHGRILAAGATIVLPCIFVLWVLAATPWWVTITVAITLFTYGVGFIWVA